MNDEYLKKVREEYRVLSFDKSLEDDVIDFLFRRSDSIINTLKSNKIMVYMGTYATLGMGATGNVKLDKRKYLDLENPLGDVHISFDEYKEFENNNKIIFLNNMLKCDSYECFSSFYISLRRYFFKLLLKYTQEEAIEKLLSDKEVLESMFELEVRKYERKQLKMSFDDMPTKSFVRTNNHK